MRDHPWDRPGLVREGDQDPNQTYLMVGRVLSQWEGVEIQLGYIYTAAVERHHDWWTMLEYGKGSAFANRFNKLQEAVSAFFVRYPNQEVEAKLNCFLVKVQHMAQRRHDVAHGIVRSAADYARWRLPHDPGDTAGFFLLPPHYKGKAFDDSALPTYVYTSRSMEELRHKLILLETEAMGIAQLLNRHAGGSTL